MLIHGAWADGSSWSGVTARLQKAGYTVDVPPNPLRGLASDSAYVASYLKSIQGPIILAGHSYGGAVITDAATGNANVKALVYVDAYIPDTGDTDPRAHQRQAGNNPGPDQGVQCRAVRLGSRRGRPLHQAQRVPGGRRGRRKSARRRRPGGRAAAAGSLCAHRRSPRHPAWKTIPSWALIGTEDMVLPPAEQVFMTHRAHSKTTKVKAAHLSMVTHPSLVTKIILRAVAATG